MEPARGGADVLRDCRGEGDDVVLGGGFDGGDPRDVEAGAFADVARRLTRNDASIRHRVRSGRLQWILNGPEMHRWHHAIEIRDGVNFATKFAFWDWLLGTARPLDGRKPSGFGIIEPFPSGFLEQQVYAFLPRRPARPDLDDALAAQPAMVSASASAPIDNGELAGTGAATGTN